MKKRALIFLLFFSFSIQAQENQLLHHVKKFDNGLDQLKYVLNVKVDSIPEDGFSKLLKIKLNSELNNLGDVFAFYSDGKALELTTKEQSVLENRVLYFAHWFVKNKKYAVVKNTKGVAPATGISLDTIAEKKVIVLLMGGDCLTTERDVRQDYIYSLFSNKVCNLLHQ